MSGFHFINCRPFTDEVFVWSVAALLERGRKPFDHSRYLRRLESDGGVGIRIIILFDYDVPLLAYVHLKPGTPFHSPFSHCHLV